MRRTAGIGALAFGVFLSGCTKPYFITELDYKHYNDVAGEVRRAEYEPQNPVPVSEPRTTSVSPSCTAKSALISSGALPKVALRKPPMPGPVW